jgi:hypothetical protein
MNHINSLPREQYKGLTSYQLAKTQMNETILDLLGCYSIEPDDVYLKPDLLIKKK